MSTIVDKIEELWIKNLEKRKKDIKKKEKLDLSTKKDPI